MSYKPHPNGVIALIEQLVETCRREHGHRGCDGRCIVAYAGSYRTCRAKGLLQECLEDFGQDLET